MSDEESIRSIGKLPDGWERKRVEDCLSTNGIERRPSIRRSAYRATGRFPVVDQGQALIAGFTDDETSVHCMDLPLIVFGDHTRALKFVDFPFATGADGTKLLRPGSNAIDTRFLYFALMNVELPSRGYNRHFGLLRQNCLYLPHDPEEQREIATVLSKLQRSIAVQEQIVGKLEHLRVATMAKLFREGLRGESLKQTELGEIPQSWDTVSLGGVCTRMNYGTSVRCGADPVGYPVLRIPNVVNERIDSRDLKFADLTPREADRYELLAGDLLFVRTNGNRNFIGRSAVYEGRPPRALFASYLIRARLDDQKVLPEFAQAFLASAGRIQITSQASPASDGKFNIDSGVLRRVLLPRPKRDEQYSVVEALKAVDDRLETERRTLQSRKALFLTTLDLLTTGQLRVAVSHADGGTVG